MLKVVWLAPYNINDLKPEVVVTREIVYHSASWIYNLAEYLSLEKEIDFHIITYSNLVNKSQTFRKNNITFHIIRYCFPFTQRGFPWYLPLDKLTVYYSFSRQAKKIINEISPDILHVHGTEAGYYLPTVNSHTPCIISIQGIITEYIKFEPYISGYLQILYEKFAVRKAKYFGCRTNFDSGFVKKYNKKSVIFDLPEAMNTVFFEQEWKPQPGLSLLFVGSIIKRKGIEDLIKALAKLKPTFPNIILKIIGSGAKGYINQLNSIIEELQIQSNVDWIGNKTPNEIAEELSKATLFVLPTLIDNSPNCLAEAMAVGIPCIATKVGGIPSMIEDTHDGMLFKKNDRNELVNRIKLLSIDTALQYKLSQNARSKAFERNYPTKVVKKYIEVYKSLIK